MQDTTVSLHKATQSPARFHLRSAGNYSAPKGQDYPLHQHSSHELIFYLSGAVRVIIEGQAIDAQPGMVLIIPPKAQHCDIAISDYAQYYLRIQIAPEIELPGYHFDDVNRSLTHVAAQITREYQANHTDKELMLSLLLQQLELLLLRQQYTAIPSKAELIVREVERLIEAQHSKAISIKDLVRPIHASASSIRSHFAKIRGYSPKQYLQQVRLKHVFELLRESDLSLEVIATLTGYDSASHLSRHVKRVTGRTPGSFRHGHVAEK